MPTFDPLPQPDAYGDLHRLRANQFMSNQFMSNQVMSNQVMPNQAPVYVEPEPQTGGQSTQNTLWVSELFGSAVRHKWVVLGLLVTGALSGYYVARFQPKVYQARASLEVQSLNDNFLNFRDLSPTGASGGYDFDIQTQAKILRSQTLVKRVVAKLSRSDKNSAGYSLHALAGVSQDFRVVVSEHTRIVDIVAEAPSATLAADFVNTLADEFVDLGLEGRLKTSQRTTEWLSLHLLDIKTRLEESQRQLQAYAGSSDLVVTSDKGNLAEEKLREIQQNLAKSESELVAKQSRWELARTSPPETLPEVLDSGSLRDYQSKLTELRRQLADLNSQYTPAYYKVQRVQAQIANLEAAFSSERDNILARIGNEHADAKRRTNLLSSAYQDQLRNVSQQAAKSVHYEMLKHEVDTNRQLYEGMLQKVKEASLASALRASNIHVVDPAEAAGTPIRPRPLYNAALGALGGLALGLCIAQLRRRSERCFQGPGEAARLLAVPELGIIGSGDAVSLKQRLSRLSGRGVPEYRMLTGAGFDGKPPATQLLGEAVPSLLTESFRSTVASILLSHTQCKVIVVASPEPMDGKTTVVSNLAVTFAALGKRVLLVDADLRKPKLHTIFDISNEPGLTDLLNGSLEESKADSLPVKTRSGVYVLPARGGTVDIAAIYGQRMRDLVLRFRRDFDIVLVDTPAMLYISDARALGRLADGVILVVRANFTDREAAWTARQRFAQDGTVVLGAVLNDWNPKSSENSYYNPKKFHKYYTSS